MCATMAEKITVDFGSCFIFILICLFSLLFYSLLFIKNKPKHSNLPPTPPSLPIIGHLHHILSLQIHRSFHNLSSKYGPLLHLRIFNFPIVLISSGSIAYEIFKSHDINISFRGFPPIDECLMFGSSTFVMSPYGDYWKFMKKLMVTKLLGTQALERSREIRANELDLLYRNLLEKARKNQIVEIGKEAIKFTNNSICKMIMGRSCSEKNSDRVRGLVTESIALLKQFFLAALLRRQLEKLGITLFNKEIMNVSNRFDELLEKVLEEHEEKLNVHQCMDMVDVLLAAYGDENTAYKITRNHIKSLLVDLFIAATDSSGQTTQWTMADIINNPKILEKLREEIDSVVGKTRLIQETDLPNLPYLQAVVKEGLRLHPPATLLMRKFQEGCNIGGFYIPEKITLFVNTYAVMRDPDIYEDPEEFKPERFLPSLRGEEDEREQSLKYIPFGSGRRGCPGENLAYIFVGTAIGVMVQCFDWKIKGEKVEMEEAVGGLNLTMAHPLKCLPVARDFTDFDHGGLSLTMECK